jgi:hypothetical protein
MMAWYTGKTFRGVDYNPTWPGWTQGPGQNDVNQRLQTFDSDMFNDAFASLWGKGLQTPPSGDSTFSVPVNNNVYRDDLGTIAKDGFNLVRLYNWDVARGTPSGTDQNKGLDHVNFLNYAKSLGLTVVVPVSDFFLNNDQFSWNGQSPNSSYSFASAPSAIRDDFKQFIASITDPSTGKIFSNVQISVGNEGDIGEGGISSTGTNPSDFLARTIWWIHNLHQQINGTGTGPDGLSVVNGVPAADGTGTVPISATFSNADQGAGGVNGSWMNWVLAGVNENQTIPNGWVPSTQTAFPAAVKGLAATDSDYASFYYDSFNIGQSTTNSPFSNTIAQTLATYDSATTPWPGAKVANVPLMLMEVFTPNRGQYPTPPDQATAAVNEAQDMEAYLKAHHAGTAASTTDLMGYNYFEFSDEPAAGKSVGLYQYSSNSQNAHTGTSGIFYISRGGFSDFTFPVYDLTPTPGPGGTGTLAAAWAATFAHVSVAPLSLVNSSAEGSGVTPFTFEVSRTGDLSEAASVSYGVTGSSTNPADAANFAGGALPTGVVSFAPGEATETVTIPVLGDTTTAPANGFTVTLFDPSAALAVVGGSSSGTILSSGNVHAYDDAYVILQDHSLTADAAIGLGVLGNDDITAGSAAVQFEAAHGQLQLGADGGVSYTPNAGFNGIDTFSYYALGADGASDIGHASIYVVPVNVGTTTTLNLLALNAQEQVAALYAAFFDRAPDAAGFEYWVNQLNQNLLTQGPQAVLTNIANSFAASAEAKALYPSLANPLSPSDLLSAGKAFLDTTYNDVLNRPADPNGEAYWLNQIKMAPQDLGSVLVNFISGAQETAAAKDITTLMSKVAVSLAYVNQQELHGTAWAGASDNAAATTLLHSVTADPQSLLVGIKNAEVLIANHA